MSEINPFDLLNSQNEEAIIQTGEKSDSLTVSTTNEESVIMTTVNNSVNMTLDSVKKNFNENGIYHVTHIFTPVQPSETTIDFIDISYNEIFKCYKFNLFKFTKECFEIPGSININKLNFLGTKYLYPYDIKVLFGKANEGAQDKALFERIFDNNLKIIPMKFSKPSSTEIILKFYITEVEYSFTINSKNIEILKEIIN